ncbi:unnamed protein product [Closterium sp. Yama58-4]|nr:unnamed protein product [Closterium sp. Yama58-4]
MGLDACDSGSPTLAFEKLVKMAASGGGLDNITESTTSPPAKATVQGFERTAFKGYFGLMLAVWQQPVVVHIEASAASFVSYDGTFNYQDPGCYTGNLDHVVLVTGYLTSGVDKSRPTIYPPFWKIRNSWGTQWGADGYMYLGMAGGDGICGINVLPGIYPVIRFPKDPCMQNAVKLGRKGAETAAMNPCGSFTCIPQKDNSNKCDCNDPSFVEALNEDGSRTCAYVDVCGSNTQNPCEVGSCINAGNGSYTCVCPPTHSLDSTIAGFSTCSRVEGIATKLVVRGNNWNCSDVHSLFGLTLDDLKKNNEKLDCTKPLEENKELNMAKEGVTPCSAFYYTLPGDKCPSIENFLKLEPDSLRELNPGFDCSSSAPLIASRSLCIERNWLAVAFMPVCLRTGFIQSKEGCAQLVESSKGKLSMLDLYRMNPGLVCNSDRSLNDAAKNNLQVQMQVCVKAEYQDFSLGRCTTKGSRSMCGYYRREFDIDG